MELKNIKQIEKAQKFNHEDGIKLFIVLVFFLVVSLIAIFVSTGYNTLLLVFATIVGGYMALSIGANDVANNVGPAVGSHAITLIGAIIIAAICEAMGAIIAGGEVVGTIKSGIIDSTQITEPRVFVVLMFAALLSAAVWLHLATFIGAPVSTTHSLVGAILGAGIIASGTGAVNWLELLRIASSWIISPVLGGLIAAAFLIVIKKNITYKEDKRKAAKRVVPILIFVMTWAFTLYLITKGLKQILPYINFGISMAISLAFAIIVFFIVRPIIAKKADSLLNTKEDINSLFTIPLIFAAALLSFAHGANDVANAIGPLAAINETLTSLAAGGNLPYSKAPVPLWIMLVGGLGISLGLALYGPRLIRTVGSEITEIDKMRAFCIAMSAALTVLLASQLGLPVSSTHIAIGAIFGVGFLREYLKKRYREMQQLIIEAHKGKDAQEVEVFLNNFNKASIKRKGLMLEALKNNKNFKIMPRLNKKERKSLKKAYKHELVKRSAINKIIASWLITVPVSALLGAFTYFVMMSAGFEL